MCGVPRPCKQYPIASDAVANGGYMETAVAFFIYNRPDRAERVFAEIARAQPPKLLVVADGPRPDHPGEAERCAAARAIVDRVDWRCEALTHCEATAECARLGTPTLSGRSTRAGNPALPLRRGVDDLSARLRARDRVFMDSDVGR